MNFVLQILKEDIHIPEIMGVDVAFYPPSVFITSLADFDFTSTSPKICVKGLNRECGFNLLLPVSRKAKINGIKRIGEREECVCCLGGGGGGGGEGWRAKEEGMGQQRRERKGDR